MIVWFDALRRLSNINDNPIKDGTKLLDTLGSVVKENEDTSMARIIVKDWLRSMKYSFTDRDDETISK